MANRVVIPLGGQHTISSLREWLGEEYEFVELWSSAVSGVNFKSQVLTICNNPKTILLVEVSDQTLIGGYTALGFKYRGGYIEDQSAIIYRLKQYGQPVWAQGAPRGANGRNSVIYCDSNTIAFGNGTDLAITSSGSVSCNPSSYCFTDGQSANLNIGNAHYKQAAVYKLQKPAAPSYPLVETPWLQINFSEE